VADKYEFSLRRENVTWSHHVEVAKLPAKDGDALLQLADKFEFSLCKENVTQI
jgi:hypothetical protein